MAELISAVIAPNSTMKWELKPGNVSIYLDEATQSLGLDIVYDSATFSAMELEELNYDHWQANDNMLLTGASIESVLAETTKGLSFKGHSAEQLNSSIHGVANKDRIIDILRFSQRKCTLPDFKHNGGREVSCGESYRRMRPICNHALLKMIKKKRAVAFSYDALLESNQL